MFSILIDWWTSRSELFFGNNWPVIGWLMYGCAVKFAVKKKSECKQYYFDGRIKIGELAKKGLYAPIVSNLAEIG